MNSRATSTATSTSPPSRKSVAHTTVCSATSCDGSSRSATKNATAAAAATATPPVMPNHSAASTVGSTSRNVAPM